MSDLHTIVTDRTSGTYRCTDEQRAAARRYLERHGALDLAEMLGVDK